MHTDWQQFLESQGAHFEDVDGATGVAAFDGPPPCLQPELADLSPLGQLRIEGPEASRFFQGYATCDLSEVAPDRALPGALCSREGRTIATFRVWGAPDALTLRLHRDLIVPVRDLLARFIVFSKADLIEPGDSIVGLGLVGEGAEALVAEICGAAPQPGEVVVAGPVKAGPVAAGPAEEPVTAIRNRGDRARFEIWLPVEQAPELWRRLATRCRAVPWSRWAAHRIRAGYIELSPRTAGEYVPQALNLQANGLISFKKGCYLGQEVVARTQHLGKLKKRMYRFSIPDYQGSPPELGSPVTVSSAEGDKVGEVVAAACDEGRCELLAVVRIDLSEAPLFVGRHALAIEELPYEVPALRARA